VKKLDEEVALALREVDWHDFIPRILLLTRAEMYKKRIYRLYPLSWKIPEDYVNEAFALFLGGKRIWKYKEVPLLWFLHGIVSSLISHDIEKASREIKHFGLSDKESKDLKIESSSEKDFEHNIATEELLTQLQKILENDALGFRIVKLVIVSGINKPNELSEVLKVPISDIYNAKKRLRRTLLGFKEHLVSGKATSEERI
jgi:hypothetical protein